MGHLEFRMVEDGPHALVIAEHLGGESGDAVALGNIGEQPEDMRTNPAILPLVPDHEGHLGPVGPFVQIIAADTDDVFAVGLGDCAEDGHVLSVVDIDEILDLLVGELALLAHEPVVDGLLREIVDQIPHARFIRWSDRAEIDLGAVIEQQGALHGLVARQ